MTNMEKTGKAKLCFVALLMGIAMLGVFVSAASVSSPQFISPSISTNYLRTQGISLYPVFNEKMCGAGQDFIVQVSPLGCSPTVVRSDLLEDQNVPVFCQLEATKINPLIDVNAIKQISFKGQYPKEVSGIGFYPARAAVRNAQGTLLNSPVLANIGYAVIVLRQQPNESSMPDFVEGNLTAQIRYDIQNAFGVGQATYYIPELSNDEWLNRHKQYGFWNGKGFLKAESVDVDSAVVSIYLNENTKLTTLNLKKGQVSEKVHLPGFFCLASLQLRLDGLEAPDTRAKLEVSGNVVEAARGEKFLDNSCVVRDLRKDGLNQRASISCRTDDGAENFELSISPKIRLEVNGEQKEYSVGDKLGISDDPNKNVYLAFAKTKENSGKESDLYVRFVQTPYNGEKLTDNVLSEVARYDRCSESKGSLIGAAAASSLKCTIQSFERFSKYLVQGSRISGAVKYSDGIDGAVEVKLEISVLEGNVNYVTTQKPESLYGVKIKIMGFGEPSDNEAVLKSNPDLRINYENAIKDYRTIIQQYPSDKEDTANSQETFGEVALRKAIILSNEASQRKTMSDLCKEFSEKYPQSKNIPETCSDASGYSNSGVSSKSILLNGNVRQISFKGIYEPTLEEYSTEITISNAKESNSGSYVIGKNERVQFSKTEFIELKQIDNNSALFDVSSVSQGSVQNFAWKTSFLRIGMNEKKVIGGDNYGITLTKINQKNLAKVSVIPDIDNAGTEANVSFRIGIEKRGIQLSPDEIKDRIDSLNASIDKWRGISDGLGKTVEGFNAACLTTGTYLTVKNFFENTDGKSIARQKVMRNEGGWTDICRGKVANKEYASLDECFSKNSEKIDKDVESVFSAIKKQQPITDETLCNKLSEIAPRENDVISNGQTLERNQKTLTANKDLVSAFSPDEKSKKCEKVTLSQARDLERLKLILEDQGASTEMHTAAKMERYKILSGINENAVGYANYGSIQEALKGTGTGVEISSYDQRNSIQGKYGGGVISNDRIQGNLKINTKLSKGEKVPAEVVSVRGVQYLVILQNTRGNEYAVSEAYEFKRVDESGKMIIGDEKTRDVRKDFGTFRKYDRLTYSNKFVNPEVQYFETDPYKGFPALVPFDLINGWYVATKQPLLGIGTSGGLRAYDESGRLTSFWLCNVGENGKAEFNSGIADDICQQFNPGTGQTLGTFQGLDQSQTNQLVGKAINAVNEAQRQYKPGISGSVRILGNNIKVGKPAVNIPDFQCQDFMSPTDCKLLFNVCDPVVCPSSRCNLGGTYNVADVAQSGIVGSTVLCSANFVGFGGDVVVPVCLTGVKAGIDGLVSVQKNYRDCLQANLDTGKTIGICDEIHSIYLCDFFWSQAAPFAEVALPKIFELFTQSGQPKTRGGGEYLGVKDAWQNAKNSVDYMTQYYGANSYSAFKALATEGVGKAVCQNFISATYPSDVGLKNLIKPRSPPQFHAWFSEQTFTTATVPATSQYKVFYHIYAGENSVQNIGAYYTVYLKSPAGTSFYQTNPTVTVASGYIAKGNYASETKDFTAPSGYKELCIRVNTQEECGFKQVTTEFALNYLKDQYLKEQASQTDIKSELECVSGTRSAYSFINPNLQAGASEFANPELYERGIVRVCSTDNPGKGTDPKAGTASGRWLEVGTCDGNLGKVKCYLDSQSVKKSIQGIGIENQTLQAASQKVNELLKQGNYIQDFKAEVEKIGKMTPAQKIAYINKELLDKALWTSQKAKLLLIRADAYADLARGFITKKLGAPPDLNMLFRPPESSVPPSDNLLPPPQNQVKQTVDDTSVMERLNLYSNIIDDPNLYLLVPLHHKSIIKAIILQESKAKGITDCNNNIESVGCFTDGKGSYGLMQLSYGAARDVQNFYFRDSTVGRLQMDLKSYDSFKNEMKDPKKNIYTGALYYKTLEDYYKLKGNDGEDLKKITLAAYNWGRGNVYDETTKNNAACYDGLWRNCYEIPGNVLQYISNVLEYEKSFTGGGTITSSIGSNCEKCGEGWLSICNQQKCNEIGSQNNKKCLFTPNTLLPGGNCVEETSSLQSTYRWSAVVRVTYANGQKGQTTLSSPLFYTQEECYESMTSPTKYFSGTSEILFTGKFFRTCDEPLSK